MQLAGALAAAARADDPRALGCEQARGLEPDALGRAGDDGTPSLRVPSSTGGYVSVAVTTLSACPSRRDRLEPRAPLAGARRPAAERDRARAGAGARRGAARARDRGGLQLRPPARARRPPRSPRPGSGSRSSSTRGLREVDVGEWSGLTTAEIEARYPGRATARRRAGGTGWERGRDARRDGASASSRRCSRSRTAHRGRTRARGHARRAPRGRR